VTTGWRYWRRTDSLRCRSYRVTAAYSDAVDLDIGVPVLALADLALSQ
jgi:hypothetical protein